MGLFGNKKSALPDLITEADFDEVANFDSALSYLVGLSGDDYTKVCQVAAIQRQADFEIAQILGVPVEPTTFIIQPEPETPPADEPGFLEDEKPKPKKVEVK